MRRLHAAAGLVLALSGCASNPPPPPVGARQADPPVVLRPLFAADYVGAAASIDLFVIRSSKFIAERSGDARLQGMALALVRDHTGTAAQLSLAGRRLNLLPAATLRGDHLAMYEALVASASPERTYLDQQVQVHEAGVRLHAAFSWRGESATLRPVAANAEAVMRRHLDELRALR